VIKKARARVIPEDERALPAGLHVKGPALRRNPPTFEGTRCTEIVGTAARRPSRSVGW